MDRRFYWGVAAALVLALLPMPYVYYQSLRLAVVIVAGVGAVSAAGRGRHGLTALLALTTLPFLLLQADRPTWAAIDLAAAAVLLWAGNGLSQEVLDRDGMARKNPLDTL